MTHSLKFYASIYALLVSVLIFVASGVVFFEVNDFVNKRSQTDIEKAAHSKTVTISQFIKFYQGIADRLTSNPEVLELMVFDDHDKAENWSLSMRRRLPDVVGVALFTDKGVILGEASSQLIGERCLSDMRQRMLDKSVPSPPIHREIPRYAHFDLQAAIKDEGTITGLVFISISETVLKSKLESIVLTNSEVIELQNTQGEVLLTTQAKQELKNPVVKRSAIPGTDWTLVYKTSAPPLQHMYTTFMVTAFVTALIISVFAVFLTTLVAKRFAHDFGSISNNLSRAIQGNKVKVNKALHLKEMNDMMPVINKIADQIRNKQQKLVDLSLTDDLTGLPNRRSLQAIIKQIAHFPARGIQTCVCIIDIDYFKKINDKYGHLTGDAVLRALSRSLKKAQRASDFIARLGGDEFIVVLIDLDKKLIEQWLNRIRQEFSSNKSEGTEIVPEEMRSLSCGYVCLDAEVDLTLSSILAKADEALYEAKARGRDTVVQYKAPTSF